MLVLAVTGKARRRERPQCVLAARTLLVGNFVPETILAGDVCRSFENWGVFQFPIHTPIVRAQVFLVAQVAPLSKHSSKNKNY